MNARTRIPVIPAAMLTVAVVGLTSCSSSGGDSDLGGSFAATGGTSVTSAPATSAAAPSSPTGRSEPAGAQVQASDGSFSVSLPSGWQNKTGSINGTIAAFIGPVVHGFAVNVNVTREDIPSGMDVATYQRAALDKLKGALTLTDVSDPEARQVDGEDALQYTFADSQSGVDLRQGQVAVIHDGVAYAITYSARAEDFDDYADASGSIVSSLHWS